MTDPANTTVPGAGSENVNSNFERELAEAEPLGSTGSAKERLAWPEALIRVGLIEEFCRPIP